MPTRLAQSQPRGYLANYPVSGSLSMRLVATLLLTCTIAGCSVFSPARGNFTKNVTEEQQMAVLLDRLLKPGMPIEDALAIMKKEGFQYTAAEESKPGKGTMYCWRSQQVSFWMERDWKVFLEYHEGKLDGYSLKTYLTGA